MAYQYMYFLNSEGVITSNLSNSGPFLVTSGAIVGQENVVTNNIGIITNSYIGTSAENGVYLQAGSSYLYITNTSYAVNDTPFDPDDRHLTAYVACFMTGTLIATPKGMREVESLRIGDPVLTADGRAIPVRWMGRQSVARLFLRAEQAPVVITAGALSSVLGGEALPERDLKLTSDHALLLDGVLVQAGALVNGSTIRRMTAEETGEHYTVWHIETEGHEAILAEGVPAETFVDNISRRRFDNFAEYEALFGAENAIAESSLPRVLSPRQLPERLRGPGRLTEAA